MDGIQVQSVFEGLTPAKCWSHYDEKYKACTEECKVSQFCIPATKRRLASVIPTTPPPPQPEKVEPTPEPQPFDYLLDSLRGKYDVAEKLDKSNDKFDVYDISEEGKTFVRVMMSKDGSNKVCLRSRSGQAVFVVDSIESAETVLAKLK